MAQVSIEYQTCPRCDGSGDEPENLLTLPFGILARVADWLCDDDTAAPCKRCGGKGRVVKRVTQ